MRRTVLFFCWLPVFRSFRRDIAMASPSGLGVGRQTLSTAAAARHISMQVCADMPRDYNEMSNDVLILLAAQQDYLACRERLTREVMIVEQISWLEASVIVK